MATVTALRIFADTIIFLELIFWIVAMVICIGVAIVALLFIADYFARRKDKRHE